jgi:hypothetical protein
MPCLPTSSPHSCRARKDLTELVSYRSVADTRQFPKSECEKAAGWIARTRSAGFHNVAISDTGAALGPAVLGPAVLGVILANRIVGGASMPSALHTALTVNAD